jgi:hypothetical protein
MSEAVELERDLFALLCKKYVQRCDERQTAMGLQYTTAETRDLARTIARFLTRRLKTEGEPVAWRGLDREKVARAIRDAIGHFVISERQAERAADAILSGEV